MVQPHYRAFGEWEGDENALKIQLRNTLMILLREKRKVKNYV